jgi:hypothetical protein
MGSTMNFYVYYETVFHVAVMEITMCLRDIVCMVICRKALGSNGRCGNHRLKIAMNDVCIVPFEKTVTCMTDYRRGLDW